MEEQAIRKVESVQAKPFLKWAGSKTQMLDDLLPKVPTSYNRYIEPLESQLLIPYESHLKDIVEIAYKQQQVSHTTANSIRHVIETAYRFEYPKKSLDKYVAESETLSNDSCVFLICQDLSHGEV